MSRIPLTDIIGEAERLVGTSCKGPEILSAENQEIVGHGCKIHIPLTFENGTNWMARVRKDYMRAPPHSAGKIALRSEAATFACLNKAGLPVPKVWLPASLDKDGRVQATASVAEWLTIGSQKPLYYFVDFVEGSNHRAFAKMIPMDPDEQTLRVIMNIAKWFIKLEIITFNKVGSLQFEPPGEITVGPVISRFIQTGASPFYLGPFSTAKQRYVSFFDTAMNQILDGTRTRLRHALVDYLTALEIKTLIIGCEEFEGDEFYIKHGEDKGDHFLVNEQEDITAVIDWDWYVQEMSLLIPLGHIPLSKPKLSVLQAGC